MNKNQSLILASAIFGLIALLHLLRAILGWPVSIGTLDIPSYVSYIAVIVAGYLAWHMYNASKY